MVTPPTRSSTVLASSGEPNGSPTWSSASMTEFNADLIWYITVLVAMLFVLLTLPTGLILGWVAKRVAVKR